MWPMGQERMGESRLDGELSVVESGKAGLLFLCEGQKVALPSPIRGTMAFLLRSPGMP